MRPLKLLILVALSVLCLTPRAKAAEADMYCLTGSTTPVWQPCVGGGWQPSLLNGLAATVTAIKSSAAGQLGLLYCENPNNSVAYVQIFDVATAGGVTLGTTTPKLSFSIPATNAAGFTLSVIGVKFSNGIQIAATTTATGSTAPNSALDCNAGYN